MCDSILNSYINIDKKFNFLECIFVKKILKYNFILLYILYIKFEEFSKSTTQ